MKMQIVSCPHCGTYLLQDTAQCHACGHILDQRSASQLKQIKSRDLPTDVAVNEDMQACPNCGETCRKGLVRCWSCSTFLRPEIEASFRAKQQSIRHQREHVDLPILEASIITEQDSLQRRDVDTNPLYEDRPFAVEESGSDGDDDFDLSIETSFLLEGDALTDNPRLANSAEETSTPIDSETFRLMYSESEPEDSKDAVLPPLQADSAEPAVQTSAAEPPVQAAEPPPSKQEVETAATEDLLKIADEEEKDIQKVRKTLRSKDSFVIYCPQGCRIRVKERHRGRAGKCPRCQSEFVVPRKVAPKKADVAAAGSEPVLASRYKKWLGDVRLHTVDPQKLRIKPDSLLNECVGVDVGFSPDDLLLATLVAGKFGASPRKIPPVRQAMIEHFLKQGTVEQLNVPAKKIIPKEAFGQFNVAQPAPHGTESLFSDIPVFGTNRIAVRIPKSPDSPHPQYLSFCLSEFRAFVEGMQSVCGIEGFGTNTEVPMNEEYAAFKCSISGVPVKELTKLNYYVKDPGFKLEVTGWQCAACKTVISEAARVETKLGGANAKGIAKAKCPKCTQKFGDQPLYQLSQPTTAEQPAAEEAAPATT
jgi:predicted Zn-ribbon and HTH transcriptional regulator